MKSFSITDTHLARCAVVYLRQSTGFQVEHNTGSTARQYQLQDQARAFGWAPERIIVIDEDLGVSGAGTRFRSGFQDLLTLITNGQVGAVFAIHESRLARNVWEFVQLLTLCEQQHVLLIIDGSVKDPREDRDRLLSLVLGAFADHENRDRGRQLRSAKLTKMRTEKAALAAPPAGYDAPVVETPSGRRRRWGEQWLKSADPTVVHALETLFAQYALLGTVVAVVRYFRAHGLQVPCRSMQKQTYGQVELRPPTYGRIVGVLKNPHYTDALVYARRTERHRTYAPLAGTRPQPMERPVEQWEIVRDHHEPYISWDTYWRTRQQLKDNKDQRLLPPRSGAALLTRRFSCGHCGYSMGIRYAHAKGPVAQGYYVCGTGDVSVSSHCLTVAASCIDPPVVELVLRRLADLTPQAVTAAWADERAVAQQQQRVRTQALKHLDAEVTAAERRFKAVDPAHTLVLQHAARDYEEALRRRAALQVAQAREPLPGAPLGGPDTPERFAQVAADVRSVWQHPAITNAERKELLRALLDRVICTEVTPGVLELTVRWHGGAESRVRTYRSRHVKTLILAGWEAGATATEIAARLTAEGVQTTMKQPWTQKNVTQVLQKYRRTTTRWQDTQRRVQALHHQGLDADQIAQCLTEEGIPALASERWTPGWVRWMLRTAAYAPSGDTLLAS